MAFWVLSGSSPARKFRFTLGVANNVNWWYTNSVSLPSFDIETSEYLLLNQKFKIPGVATWNDVSISLIDTKDSVEQLKSLLEHHDFDYDAKYGYAEGIRKINTSAEELRAQAKEARARGSEAAIEARKLRDQIKKLDPSATDFESEKRRLEMRQVAAQSQATQQIRGVAQGLEATAKKASQKNDFIIQQVNDSGESIRAWTLVNSFIKSVNYGDLDYSADDFVNIELVVSYDYATTEK